jgi:hypothetical protein
MVKGQPALLLRPDQKPKFQKQVAESKTQILNNEQRNKKQGNFSIELK